MPSMLERALFGIGRALAFLLAIFSVWGLYLTLNEALDEGRADTTVTLSDVQQSQEKAAKAKAPEEVRTLAQAAPETSVPENLSPYLGGDNAQILAGWLEHLEVEAQEDFLGNMSDVVVELEVAGTERETIIAAINTYRLLKLPKLVPASEMERTLNQARRAAAAGAALAMAMILLMSGLALVLLGIERNTRRPTPPPPAPR